MPAPAPADDWFAAAAAAQQESLAPQPGPAAMLPAPAPAGQQVPAEYALPATAAAGSQGVAPGLATAAPAQPAPERRRRLSAGWIAFIVLAVVLVAVVAVFAWTLLSRPSPRTGGAMAPTTTATAPKAASTATAPALATFASPSGNISCEITAGAVTCSIAQLNQQPAPSDTCDGTVGYRVVINAEGEISMPCVPATQQPEPAPASMQKLEYGQSVTTGQFTCTSEQSGMQCEDTESGKGFSLARAGIGTH